TFLLLFSYIDTTQHIYSFPTRRSSDLVDEEQRFGVAHKERLKEMRKNVDALALSATPIPRTLHMSLESAWRRAQAHRHSCAFPRSEEHTSELQSRGHLVCRLLL